MLFAQYICCSPSMEVQIEETGNRKQALLFQRLLPQSHTHVDQSVVVDLPIFFNVYETNENKLNLPTL